MLPTTREDHWFFKSNGSTTLLEQERHGEWLSIAFAKAQVMMALNDARTLWSDGEAEMMQPLQGWKVTNKASFLATLS